jgi:predicted nicotinamide N-methyase
VSEGAGTPNGGPTGAALIQELERRFVTEVEEVPVGAARIPILRPRSAEDLISEEDFVHDERLPYWADVWPSARVLAARVLAERGAGRSLLELGCGVGLVAVAAARAGFAVTVTDYYEDALLFARANVWRATGAEPEARLVDWRALPGDLGRFDLVVASDVLYERPYAQLVARALALTLVRGGTALVTDPGRVAAPAFLEEAVALGLDVGEPEVHPIDANGVGQTIRLHTLRRR